MIPKIIHYCWFSNDPKPALVKKCINSWKKYLPDYELREWDGNSFDFQSLDFTKEALDKKKYAFVSDYIRLYALYQYGGIYLDTDVEVFKSFDSFLDNQFFSGIDCCPFNTPGNEKYSVEAGVMGCEKGNVFVHECMRFYETNNFEGQILENIIAPNIYGRCADKYGFERMDKEQLLSTGMHFYPRNIIANGDYLYSYNDIDYSSLYAIHHNMNTWANPTQGRGLFWKLCYKMNKLGLYRKIETVRTKLFK